MSILGPLTPEQIAILGFMLGPIGRTFYDYFWAIKDEPGLAFDKNYFITMIASIIISLIAGIFYLFSFMQTIAQNLPPDSSAWFIFSWSFSQGFVLNHLINKPMSSHLKR